MGVLFLVGGFVCFCVGGLVWLYLVLLGFSVVEFLVGILWRWGVEGLRVVCLWFLFFLGGCGVFEDLFFVLFLWRLVCFYECESFKDISVCGGIWDWVVGFEDRDVR